MSDRIQVTKKDGVADVKLVRTDKMNALGDAMFEALLGDGSAFGVDFSSAVQPEPNGLAEAFIIGADFVSGGPSALILGDNIYHGEKMGEKCRTAAAEAAAGGANVFAYHVDDPERYGVADFDPQQGRLEVDGNLGERCRPVRRDAQ